MMLAELTDPRVIASMVARLAEWHMPASSAWTMSDFRGALEAGAAAAEKRKVRRSIQVLLYDSRFAMLDG